MTVHCVIGLKWVSFEFCVKITQFIELFLTRIVNGTDHCLIITDLKREVDLTHHLTGCVELVLG